MAFIRSIWQEDILIEIMDMIVKRVSIGDYVCMAAVCKSWRSMLARCKTSNVEPPWILQLKDCLYNDHIGFNFYSLSDSCFYSFKLSDRTLNKYPKLSHGFIFCCATSNGWLALVAGPNHDPGLLLLDPVSDIDVKLPSLTTFPSFSDFEPYGITSMVNMVYVFSISNDPIRNLIVVADFMDMPNDGGLLAFCNCDIRVIEEDRSWEVFDANGAISHHSIESMLFHNGVLYALISNPDYIFYNTLKSSEDGERISEEINHVVVLKNGCCEVNMKIINIVRHNTAPHIRLCDTELAFSGLRYVHLVKSITGELLIIWSKTDSLSEHDDVYDYLDIYHTSKLTIERYEGIYKTGKDFESIPNLDDQALFVSPNSNSFSIPVRSDHNGCQSNCIYFTVDAFEAFYKKSLTLNRQSGIYCMKKGKIKRPFLSPPLWFQPRLRN